MVCDITAALQQATASNSASTAPKRDREGGAKQPSDGASVIRHHVLELFVPMFGRHSWLEDQDQWWLAGIHRAVYIQSLPRAAHIHTWHASSSIPSPATAAQARVEHAAGQVQGTVTVRQGDAAATACAHTLQLRAQICTLNGRVLADSAHAIERTAGCEVAVPFEVFVSDVHAWSTESPNVYLLVLQLVRIDTNTSGEDVHELQCEVAHVGFRKVDIATQPGSPVSPVLRLNDVPVSVCGVNRHEHHARLGKQVRLCSRGKGRWGL